MQLITTHNPKELVVLDDEAIEAFFAEAGITVEVVDHCDDASCPDCFRRVPARAA